MGTSAHEQDKLYVVCVAATGGGTNTYIITVAPDEDYNEVAQAFADNMGFEVEEVMEAQDFLCGEIYELCSTY